MNYKQFKYFFDKHYANLCLYAYRFVNDEDQAKDIVQEAFLTVWENRADRTIENLQGYLFRAVRNNSLDYIRDNKKLLQFEIESIGESLDETTDDDDVYALLEYLLSQVPLKSREMFEMSRTMGMKYQEIAFELGISVKTVEKHISKVLNHILTQLKKHGIELKAKNKIKKRGGNLRNFTLSLLASY